MTWLVINAADNSVAAGPVDAEPAPGDGQYVVEVCLGCVWDQAIGGFRDAVKIMSRLGFFLLFTAVEQSWILNSTVAEVVLARSILFLADTVDLSDPWVIGTVEGFVALGSPVTAPRAARVLSGLAPLPS